MDQTLDERRHVRLMNTVLARSDITAEELWLRYFSIGGTATEYEVAAHLQGLIFLARLQRKLLEWAAREIIADSPGPVSWEDLISAT